MGAIKFELLHVDKYTGARRGRIYTPHGVIETPTFMPVGTNATVKTLTNRMLEESGTQIILANAFHLFLKPGLEVLNYFKGIHNFMNWKKPILTDSGGFQVFSLKERKITDDGVEFKSPLNGERVFFTPELSMKIQQIIASDIAMAFDECVEPSASKEYVEISVERTYKWAIRSLEAHKSKKQALFGIIQGGFFEDLREKSLKQITSLPFDGFAVGGLSVGEPIEETERILRFLKDKMPEDKPRYIMGIGTPKSILLSVENGMDMFDCVFPTRLGRHGEALTWNGRIKLKKSLYRFDSSPIEEECNCYACKNHTKAYIHHLITRDEFLAKTLLSLHNITFLNDFVRTIREAIENDSFKEFKEKYFGI